MPEHVRYDSEEFNYSGCVVCDTNGDTFGWPCPTLKAAQDAVNRWPVFYDPTVTSVEGD